MSQKTLAEKILAYLDKHPKMRVKDVAEHFNVHTSYIYAVRRKAGQEPGVSRPIVNPEITMEPDETNVDQVLDSRAKDYGKFIEGAEIMQMLKRVVHNYIEKRGTPLAFDQREAIDMIIHKLGRIINGNPDKVDSWRDVAGYSTLVADRLEGNAR
jgi:predicted ArsR family transcriptional regulator